MDWYYADGQERKGPVGEEEFQRLAQQGVINGQTLVWNDTMSDWKPYSSILNPPPLSMAPALSTDAVVCAGCRASFSPDAVVSVAGAPFCAACKPMALQRLQEGVGLSTDAEKVRNEYLKHEASVKSVGMLFRIGGLFLIIAAIGSLVSASSARDQVQAYVIGAFLLIFGVLQLWVGIGLKSLRPWSRVGAAVISALGLLGFPFGTLINLYILYLLLGKKGKMVFSTEYAAVIQQTPHIKYRTSWVIWVLLGFVVLLLLFAFGATILGKR